MNAGHIAMAVLLTCPVLAVSQQESVREETSQGAISKQPEPQALADAAAAQTAVEAAAEKIAAGEISAALTSLQPHWALPKEEIEKLVAKLDGQRAALEIRFGEPLEMELAGVQTLGDSFRRFVYLEKYERHALAWTFTFYRPKEGWILNTLSLSERLDSLYRWE